MVTLPEAVRLLADVPIEDNRRVFFRVLASSKLGARLPVAAPQVPPGDHKADGTPNYAFPNATGPDGSTMILAWCDIPGMMRKFPDERFFEVDAQVVLQMAANGGYGIIVQHQSDDSPTWAGVSADDVGAILVGAHDA